jgi:CheY-like chemotaxis protein
VAKIAKAILLAEDLEDDEFFLMRVLREARLGNPIIVVRDGAEAIAYLKGEPPYDDRAKFPFPAILFLDLKMPRRHGQDVLRWLQTQPALGHLQVFVVSHYEDAETFKEIYAFGVKLFLNKPVKVGEINNLIRLFPGEWHVEE